MLTKVCSEAQIKIPFFPASYSTESFLLWYKNAQRGRGSICTKIRDSTEQTFRLNSSTRNQRTSTLAPLEANSAWFLNVLYHCFFSKLFICVFAMRFYIISSAVRVKASIENNESTASVTFQWLILWKLITSTSCTPWGNDLTTCISRRVGKPVPAELVV